MKHLLILLAVLLIAAPIMAAGGGGEHGAAAPHEKTYFGMPAWVLKLVNMILFFGVLAYILAGPVRNAVRGRGDTIRQAADEARVRREKADQVASDIQTRLSQIEQEVRAIRERAETDGERQKRELIAAGEAEAAKIVAAARNEVENRLKRARQELTEYAGELATARAAAILKETITEADQRKLFEQSLQDLREVQG
ncbi:MAG: ATP synthase F0 subunit B [Thermoanaerobaculia bacterium]|nr:ATP synthase F0 subunit B [Thermoanaerobaculia bacterium]